MDLTEIREKMEKAFRVLTEEVATVQAGRATPAMVESIVVDAYETRMPLVELATITVPEPSQLLITPFDQSVIKNIQAAISSHKELKLSCLIDEQSIRVQIPPLTAERREEFIKLLGQKLETGRVMIRQIRQEKRIGIKRSFEAEELSEDAKFRLEKDLQEVTDEFMEKIKKIGERKEEELRKV
ncbi:ribosome-recycling factor [Patescibacteria group bacterium]